MILFINEDCSLNGCGTIELYEYCFTRTDRESSKRRGHDIVSVGNSSMYRPVSLTSVICKLLERLIKDHMVEFLVKHKLVNSSQHGFLKARS